MRKLAGAVRSADVTEVAPRQKPVLFASGASGTRVIFDRVIAECNLVVSWRARPRGFVALMGVYESNYLRLAGLAGNLNTLAATAVPKAISAFVRRSSFIRCFLLNA